MTYATSGRAAPLPWAGDDGRSGPARRRRRDTGRGDPGPGLDDELLGGPAARTAAEVARELGTGVEFVHEAWRALGLPAVDEDERIFTAEDVRALREILELAEAQHLDESTVTTLLRSTGHTMDRLVLWQAEALVGDLVELQGYEPVAARLELLDRLPGIAPVLERQLTHAWRRQLAAYAGRYAVEFSHAREEGAPGRESSGSPAPSGSPTSSTSPSGPPGSSRSSSPTSCRTSSRARVTSSRPPARAS
ncbi:hypothetical protein GCM10025864_00790 [Luteimicrobium album]|uniref:MerR family transcriptional regulator n=1 Tax=Luteimicrobium album TaxID=1054550 RepID=A0ABQ6HXM2_9MICO|nr:hypothetical protein [Luteimicrobium album]GMA22320.1 hypothetical protein GCM10025864_00790 [Luteimicrobium album]